MTFPNCKDNFGMIKEVITEKVAKAAPHNEGYGEQCLTLVEDA